MIIGIDEAGIGALAGSVVVAAVILDEPIYGLRDSKKISENRRFELAREIKQKAKYWIITGSNAKRINKEGISRCHKACIASVGNIAKALFPEARIILDGNTPVSWLNEHETMVKADDKIPEVSAASILAKTHRDELMYKLAERYPRYGWDRNKGYGTQEHLRALDKYGVTREHRRYYDPVRKAIMKRKHI